MLDVRDLSFSYGKETIFDNIRLTAIIGELTIIKGESGSGKTTLLDILALKYGIHCDFYFDNLDLKIKENKKNYQDHLYYMSQKPIFCYDLTLDEQWSLLRKMYSAHPQLEEFISLMGLDDKKSSYPSQLSGGEQLRAMIINMFIIQPQIILMDEPTASLDDEYKMKFIQLLHILKEKSYLIIATHDPYLFKEGDKIYEIKDQKFHLIKDSQVQEKEFIIDALKKNNINWILYFFIMKKHHIFKEIFTCLLVSLAIMICAFSTNIDNGFLSSFEENLKTKNNQSVLVYKSLDSRYPTYNFDITSSTYFPITDIEQKSILDIQHIKQIKPKIILSTYVDELPAKEILPSFHILKDNEEIYNYNDTIEQLKSDNNYNYYNLFIEGIEETEIEKYQTYSFDKHEKGLYLNQSLLNRLQLKADDLKDCLVKIKVGIPTYDVSGAMEITIPSGEMEEEFADDDFSPANLINCQSVELSLPINGVLETGYESNTLVTSDYAMYMLSDSLEALARSNPVDKGYTVFRKDTEAGMIEVESQKDADLVLVYTPWQPNAYTVAIDHIENMQSVVNELENLGYTVDWEYNQYQSYAESIRSTKEMAKVISFSFLFFTILIVSGFHFLKGKEEQKLNLWLNHIGYYRKKDIIKVKLQKYLLNAMITAIVSYVLLWVVNYISIYVYYTPYIINIKSWLVIIGISIISQTIIPILWEGIYHVKN